MTWLLRGVCAHAPAHPILLRVLASFIVTCLTLVYEILLVTDVNLVIPELSLTEFGECLLLGGEGVSFHLFLV